MLHWLPKLETFILDFFLALWPPSSAISISLLSFFSSYMWILSWCRAVQLPHFLGIVPMSALFFTPGHSWLHWLTPLFWLILSGLAPNRCPHWLLPPAQNAHEPSQVLTAVTWSTAICYHGCLARLICLLASHGCTCPMPRISLLSYLTSYCNEWLGIFV